MGLGTGEVPDAAAQIHDRRGILDDPGQSCLYQSLSPTQNDAPKGNHSCFCFTRNVAQCGFSGALARQLTRNTMLAGCALVWYGAVLLAVAATASPMGTRAPSVRWGGSGKATQHAVAARHRMNMGNLQLRGGGKDAEYDSKDAMKYDRNISSRRREIASV